MYDRRKQFRISDEMDKRMKAICNHLKMKESDAFREALRFWIVDKEWKLRLKRWFVEEE